MTEDLQGRAARARDGLVAAFEREGRTAPPLATIHRRAARQRATRGALALLLVVAAGAGVLRQRAGTNHESSVVAGQPTAGSPGPVGKGQVDSGGAVVPPTTETPSESYGPPPVTLRFGGTSMKLNAYSFCWSEPAGPGTREARCADGVAPAVPPDVGNPPEIQIEFPVPGFAFSAAFQPAGQACGRVQTVPVERRADGTFLLRPAGYAETYDVTLSGRGGDSLTTVFRWTTPTDGPRPVPQARLALVSGHDGQISSYGVELEVDNLSETPKTASATITATAANGRSLTFGATRSTQPCSPKGTIYWDGPKDKGQAAASLGAAPFAYQVVLNLDGVRYEASARWPDDVIAGNEPSVALRFNPPLPALS
jgi:hypothetical protein